jgi:lipid A 3-O-deacylase
MKAFRTTILLCGLFILLGASAGHAQSAPEKGSREIEVWTGGGYGVKGVAKNTGVWNAGLRYGWVLTDAHGPGVLRGRFEYAVDAVPVFWLFQPGGLAYGMGLNPFAFKWILDTKGKAVPYFELGGGTLFTNVQAPAGTSRANFTDSAAIGIHFLGARWTWTAEVRYMHISNAGIGALNPGINTMQVRLGLGTFTHPH